MQLSALTLCSLLSAMDRVHSNEQMRRRDARFTVRMQLMQLVRDRLLCCSSQEMQPGGFGFFLRKRSHISGRNLLNRAHRTALKSATKIKRELRYNAEHAQSSAAYAARSRSDSFAEARAA